MTLALEFNVEDEGWFETAPWYREITLRIFEQTLIEVDLPPRDREVSVLLSTDQRIADLNAEFRDNPTPTNVLSWPAEDCAPDKAPYMPDDGFLGDLAFARETIEKEAEKQHLEAEAHFAHLFCHGVLHLMGYDHQTEADAEVMEGVERRALARLGIADPYAPRDE